jgi:hypothetical protein
VADRAIENDLAPAPNTQSDSWMKAHFVKAHDRVPNRLDVLRRQAYSARIRLAVTLGGHLLRIEDANGYWK